MTGDYVIAGAAFAALLGVAVWKWPKRRRASPQQQAARDDEEVRAKIAKGLCPDCGRPDLLEGPRGGCAVNIACDYCHSEFNVGFGFGDVFLVDRMGKLTPQRGALYGIPPGEFA